MTVTVHELIRAQNKLIIAEDAAQREWGEIQRLTRELRERDRGYENFRWAVDNAREELAELHQRIKDENRGGFEDE